MTTQPTLTPRPEVFATYWRFAAKRQHVFYRRLAGLPPPWSDDPILLQFKFTNAYRASDRVSQFLIKEVIYGAGLSEREEDVVFRTLLFRLFNQNETWVHLSSQLGEPSVATFDEVRYGKVLEEKSARGETLFGSAYIVCANRVFGFERKHDNYLALIRHMLNDGVVEKVVGAKSFAAVYELLLGYPLIGKFMAYQIATDLNYTPVIDFDENSFTMAGPGALRGIAKCFENTRGTSPEDVIHWMVEHQEEELQRVGYDPQSVWLWGRRLKAIDCQNLFCETDKYSRVAFPGLKSNRKRIKVMFRPTAKAIPYFYPPKWGINEQLAQLPPIPPLSRESLDWLAEDDEPGEDDRQLKLL